MKREEILKKLDFTVPPTKMKRVIISTDLNNEADDHFAVMHHLLTPSEEVVGIIASHYEWSAQMFKDDTISNFSYEIEGFEFMGKYTPERGGSMEASYKVGEKLLELAKIDDVPLYRGSKFEIRDINNLPECPGADLIIKEALKNDDRPLYVTILGAITDLAIAYLKEPKIAEKITAIWIGGAEYPNGNLEFNLMQDVIAANIIFESPMAVWQIPANVYSTVEVSQAELNDLIRPCGILGEYLCNQMNEFSHKVSQYTDLAKFPHGETWCLGDNPTVTVLLQNNGRVCWHEVDTPHIKLDGTYEFGKINKKIRVYDSVDSRLTLSDFYSKMRKCYI